MKKVLNLLATTILTTGLLSACVQQSSVSRDDGAMRAVTADDLLVVDCLLPGQVRKLGTQMTYLTKRRPIQTSVHDCQIRGGEYVLYDRATYKTALTIWLPLAEEGDPDAQNKIGEIYERGVGSEPDYTLAAAWYRKAAEQGHKRAQINLGFLYEKGLGVERDPEAALAWYRKASELPDAVMIDKQALEAQQAQISSLSEELDRSRRELEQARRELRSSERRLQQEREKLRQRLQQSPTSGLSGEQRRRLEESRRRLEQQRVELAQRQERIRELESKTRRQQESLLLFESEGASQREQLKLVRTQLERSRKDLRHYQELAAQNERLLADAQADLAALAADREGAAYQRIQSLAAQLSEREQALGQQEHKVAQLQQRVSELNGRLDRARSSSLAEKAELEQALARSRDALEAAQAAARERAAALERVQGELASLKGEQDASTVQVAELQVQLKERERIVAEQKEMVQRLRKESDQLQQKLQQLEQEQSGGGARLAQADEPTAPPSIQLIDPPLVAVRGGESNRIPVKRGLKHRTVVGQVTAPAGLYALNINGVRSKPDTKGLFEVDIQLSSDETPVSVVAVDRQGRRSTLAFSLVAEQDSDRMVAKRINPLEGVEVGGYHALVIGNQDYDTLPDLDTAVADAEAVSKVLRDKFGYKVTLLRNADRYEILSALNSLRKELTDKDNLLVYYAGHGELDRVNLRGHWLPVDAEMHNTANWISNVSITDILNAMSVRHVLLVADSCYSGALTRSALSQLDAGQSDEARNHWLKTLSKMRSRTALTSGGLAPVLDGGGGEHSVFAKAFLGVLRDLNDITEGQRVYREVSARVAFEATRYQVEQVPEYAPIKYAGHEAGDYLFIPRTYL